MRVDEWADILGDIPNLMKETIKLEGKIAPIMVQVNKHRDKMDPALLSKFDEQMREVEQAKIKLKNANINYK